MELYVIEDYKTAYPDLKGSELTEALVRELLVENGYVEAGESIRIQRLEKGKPVLNDYPQIRFSVSHTADTFACVIDAEPGGSSIGLDIQKSRGSKIDLIAKKCLTDEEIQWMGDDADRFFQIWCRKEAYSKFTGEGLTAILAKAPVFDRSDVSFHDLVLGDGLFGCICTDIKEK